MKVLVLSDSHGYGKNAFLALEKEKDCKTVFFLGDGIRDIESIKKDFSDKQFIIVRGNNDYGSDAQLTAYKYIDGCTVVAAHGHMYSVKYGLYDLLSHAEGVRANVVFYGHTHRADIRYDHSFGIYAVNPGALCDGRYAVVDLIKGEAEAEFKSVY